MKPDAIGGAALTLADFSNWLANASGLSDNHRRGAQQVLNEYRRSVVTKMVRVYDDGASHNERQQETAERILEKLRDRITEAMEQAQRGEIKGPELMELCVQVNRDAQRWVAMSEAAEKVEARAWDEVDRSPEEWQRDVLARVPALRTRLPLLTDAVIEGREKPQF